MEVFRTGVNGGVNKDLAPQDLDANTYSSIHNLRMQDGRLIPVRGHEKLFSPLPASIGPSHAFGVVRAGVPVIYMGANNKIYKYASSTWADVSRLVGGVYTTDAYWNHTVLNGCIFMNNGSDMPQVLEAGDNEFKDSANWPTTLRAKVMRPFKDYMFGFNLTNKPQGLIWSDPALSGTEPPSWDITDPTTQAGEIILADTDGDIVEAQQLGDSLVIYKTDAVYVCRFIGGVYIFSFQKLFNNRGALNTHCVATFDDKHFVIGYNDIYVHDGLQFQSVAEGRVKTYFYKDLDQDKLDKVFAYANYTDKEVWVCYPNDAAVDGACNKALVWNWVHNVWTTRDLPNCTYITNSSIETGIEDTWDGGENSTWDLGANHWDSGSFSPAVLYPLMTSKLDEELYWANDTALFDTEPITYLLEKLSNHYQTPEVIKQISYVTPDVEGTGLLTIRQGGQFKLGEGISWKNPSQFPIGEYRVYLRGGARYLSFRYEGSTDECIPAIRGADIYVTMEGMK